MVKKVIQSDEIKRDEIMQLTGALYSKVCAVSVNNQYGFPLKKRIVNRGIVFDREKVLAWIAKNDLKTMVLKHRIPYKKTQNKRLSFNKMAFDFLLIKPIKQKKERIIPDSAIVKKYKKIKHKVVHLQDVHEHAEIRHTDSFAQIHDANHRMDTNV
jgi:hypothetical protein